MLVQSFIELILNLVERCERAARPCRPFNFRIVGWLSLL
jgi:hypothetical protein